MKRTHDFKLLNRSLASTRGEAVTAIPVTNPLCLVQGKQKICPADTPALANLAKTDTAEGTSAPAAPDALNIARVDASVDPIDSFSLYNPASGWNNIAQAKIAGRVPSVDAVYEQAKALGDIVQGSQNFRCFDAANHRDYRCAT